MMFNCRFQLDFWYEYPQIISKEHRMLLMNNNKNILELHHEIFMSITIILSSLIEEFTQLFTGKTKCLQHFGSVSKGSV